MKEVLVIILIFCWNNFYAQDLFFRNYEVEHGLPSSEVHDIYEDANGFMWFATDRGIARFDGSDFYIINTQNGLPANVIFNFFEQQHDRVWISTKENNLYWFNPIANNWKFHPYKYNDSLTLGFTILGRIEFIRNLVIDVNNTFYISFLSGTGLLKIDKQGKCEVVKTKGNQQYKHFDSQFLIHLEYVDNRPLLFTEFLKVNQNENNEKVLFWDHNSNDTIVINLDFDYNVNWQYGIADYVRTKTDIRFILGKYLFIYRGNEINVKEIPSEALRIYFYGDYTFITTYRGVYIYDRNLQIREFSLTENIVTSICLDFEGGFWFSTVENGVYYNSNLNYHTYSNNIDQKLTLKSIQVKDDWIVCSNLDKTLLIIDRKGRIVDRFSKVNYHHGFYVTSEDLTKYLGEKWSHSHFDNLSVYANEELIIDDNLAVDCGGSSITVHTRDTVFTNELNLPHANDNITLNDSIILTVTGEGLYEIVNYSKVRQFFDDAERWSKMAMNEIVPFYKGFVISAENEGLLYLQDSNIIQFTTDNGLLTDHFVSIHAANDTLLFAGSSAGLNVITVDPKNDKLNIASITTNDGLLNNEITYITSQNDTLWMGTKKGICFTPIKLGSLTNHLNKDYFRIDSVQLDNRKAVFRNHEVKMKYGSRLDIFFNQLSFFPTKTLNYQYEIIENATGWLSTNENHIVITNLEPGEYTLKVKPIINSANNSELILKILVDTPFWRTWWFIIFLFLSLSGIIFLISKILISRLERQRQKELDKLKLELKALIAQMNPHFTFNTINSIQHYIIKKDKKEALNYLAEFALLMRRTLEYSRREFISLREEIEFLKLYAELENKRFDKPFVLKFNIDCKSSLDEIEFPALFLQPILENAIIHGVMVLKEKQGQIEISIKEFSDYFSIRIKDNGPGKKAAKIKLAGKNESFGLDILRQRLKIYNAEKYKDSDFGVTFYENSNIGVEVKLKLNKQDL